MKIHPALSDAFGTFLRNALLILPPAFLFSMKSDLPHIFLLTLLILVIRMFRKRDLPYRDRPVIYCLTAALVMTVIPDLLTPADTTRFGLFDVMLRSTLAVPFLLYAAARIHSIFRKIGAEIDGRFEGASTLETEQEIALARKLIALPSVFELTLSELRPHYLCTYLYELAGAFSTFYNANKVIVDDEGTKQRRLMLCARTLRVLETGLRLLGIEPLQKM